MSMKRTSRRSGKEFSRAEALDTLAQCKLLRMSLDVLEERAKKALKPRLRVVDAGKRTHD